MVMGVWTRQTWLYHPSSWWLYSLNIEPLSYKTPSLNVQVFCLQAICCYLSPECFFCPNSAAFGTLAEKPRAPSYFSEYFKCQLAQAEDRKANGEPDHGIKTLYIDRDPTIFSDISRHLQGYHIQPRDGSHFVKLFADAQFYQRK